MIPKLTSQITTDPLVYAFGEQLKQHNFNGDIEHNHAERLVASVDNSIYQFIPSSILYPKNIDDLLLITKLANLEQFKSLTFTPKGGGTGTNGQSLNFNLIVDMSRHMCDILEINPQEKWVRVQSGVVKDALNLALKPYGLFFAPELSTSNRATIGGMISTDACGQGSVVYGKTSDHVLELTSVMINGDILHSKAENIDPYCQRFSSNLGKKDISQQVFDICYKNIENIKKLPPLNRFITGYDLKHPLDLANKKFNLSRIICGSEGTLGLVAEAKLNLLSIPKYRVLVNVKYRSFHQALDSAPLLLKAQALSVETIDSKVLGLAKADIIWHSVKDLLTESAENPILGINIVEFAGDNQAEIEQKINDLELKLTQASNSGIIGWQICRDLDSINLIYAMRKKSVGLLGNAKGWAKPIPFVEDTAVPPENLSTFIKEFRQILDENQLEYGMFGHVDAGVLHVRPAIDLSEKSEVARLLSISDQVAALCIKHGGVIWGEHGKGVRGVYAEEIFGETLWREVRKIKAVFDPNNRLNSGKICTPLGDEQHQVMPIKSQMRADNDRQIPIAIKEDFKGAMTCNGNGLCFNFQIDDYLCPSMKFTRNRLYSPKGRATVVREWLRLLATDTDFNPADLDFYSHKSQRKNKYRLKWLNKFNATDDFSHEVKQALDTCLACKACASLCPIKIDVPEFRSKFFQLYHTRYPRPVRDHLIANLENLMPILNKMPKLINLASQNKIAATLLDKGLKIVDIPKISSPNLAKILKNDNLAKFNNFRLDKIETEQLTENTVFIVQDAFTSGFEAKLVANFVKLVKLLGFNPQILPLNPNGKALHIKGFLPSFYKNAQKQANYLNQISALGFPLIGIDPALTMCYSDEYRQVLGEKRGDFEVLTPNQWLSQQINAKKLTDFKDKLKAQNLPKYHLFAHCTESSKRPDSINQWINIFKYFGIDLVVEKTSCCGMAGIFGHESQNQTISTGIYQISWQKKLTEQNFNNCLATGYSCRSQVKRLSGVYIKHPCEVILQYL